MKTQNGSKAWIAVLVAMLALLGCPTDSDPAKNGAATLTSISVGDAPVTPVPAPVPRDIWDSEGFSLSNLPADQTGEAVISDAALLNEVVISVVPSAGAQVRYAASDGSAKPQEFQSSPVTLAENGYLVIQVTGEDGGTVNYYVVKITTLDNTTNLLTVTVGDVNATLGASNAKWEDAAAGNVVLSTAGEVTIGVTKAADSQTVKYAKANGDEEPVFDDTATFSVVDGDFLYIEVTAANGVTKAFYKLEIQISRDITLSALTIGGTPVTDRGTPEETIALATEGRILFSSPQPDAGYTVSITATDSAATVEWAAAATDSGQLAFGTVSPIVFSDNGYLYVKVTAANNTTTGYYKIRVNLMQTATIKYGSPEIRIGSEKYIDPAWDSVTETYSIAKIYRGESNADYVANPTTSGIAKALFDKNGLYVYVKVTDQDVDVSSTGTHTKDSVELFINEAVDVNGDLIKTPASYDDTGGQYRIGANGQISGDPTLAQDAMDSTKVSAWTTDDGYIVIFQAPWRFLDQYPLENGKKIGFELQINACSNGDRDGVMVWNNIAHTNYQNVSDYGEAVLELNAHDLLVNAKNPNITDQPKSAIYTSDRTPSALTVAAVSPDSGTLTYQWYSNGANSYDNGTLISGANAATYTPTLSSEESTTWYWVVVTNTIPDNSDGGTKAASLQSNRASIVVSAVIPMVEKIVAGSCGVPVYRFTLPSGKTWSDYKEITYTVLINDATTLGFTSNQIRSHIVGDYGSVTPFGSSGEMTKQQDWGPHRLIIITNGGGISNIVGSGYASGTWKTLTYSITSPDGAASMKPAANATGPFYLGIGFAVNDSNAAGAAVTYYVKDVALVGTDDSKLAADPLSTVDGTLTLGQLKVRFQGGPGVTRSLEPEPASN
jgi:hypothetical protein